MNSSDKSSHQPIVKEVSIARPPKSLTGSRTKKALYSIAGVVTLILAILGIVIPGLPCTPFAILSAALFAKSSDKLYNWLLSNKILGPRIMNYQRRKGISKSGKVKVLVLMWTMVLISSLLIIKIMTLKIIILSAGIVGSIVVWFFVPEGKEPEKL